jgi:hypothetical protein
MRHDSGRAGDPKEVDAKRESGSCYGRNTVTDGRYVRTIMLSCSAGRGKEYQSCSSMSWDGIPVHP